MTTPPVFRPAHAAPPPPRWLRLEQDDTYLLNAAVESVRRGEAEGSVLRTTSGIEYSLKMSVEVVAKILSGEMKKVLV